MMKLTAENWNEVCKAFNLKGYKTSGVFIDSTTRNVLTSKKDDCELGLYVSTENTGELFTIGSEVDHLTDSVWQSILDNKILTPHENELWCGMNLTRNIMEEEGMFKEPTYSNDVDTDYEETKKAIEVMNWANAQLHDAMGKMSSGEFFTKFDEAEGYKESIRNSNSITEAVINYFAEDKGELFKMHKEEQRLEELESMFDESMANVVNDLYTDTFLEHALEELNMSLFIEVDEEEDETHFYIYPSGLEELKEEYNVLYCKNFKENPRKDILTWISSILFKHRLLRNKATDVHELGFLLDLEFSLLTYLAQGWYSFKVDMHDDNHYIEVTLKEIPFSGDSRKIASLLVANDDTVRDKIRDFFAPIVLKIVHSVVNGKTYK